MALGLVTTTVAALRPAVRAGRTSPMRAFQEAAGDRAKVQSLLPTAGLLGGSLLVVYAAELAPSTAVRLVTGGVGVAVFFVSVPAVTARVLGPLTRLVLRLRGGSIVASLAATNAARTPRRTAAAAAAMIVGLSLVTGVTIVGASEVRSST